MEVCILLYLLLGVNHLSEQTPGPWTKMRRFASGDVAICEGHEPGCLKPRFALVASKPLDDSPIQSDVY